MYEKTNTAKEMVAQIISEIDPALSFHDFRMVSGPHHTNLIFDVVIPFSAKLDSKNVVDTINANLQNKNNKYYAVITVDHSYT